MTKIKFHEVIKKLGDYHTEIEMRKILLGLGLEFFEENDPDKDSQEEQAAGPKNDRQRQLISFFNSEQAPSFNLLNEFLAEKESPNTHYPLMRRYFKASNKQLKKLLLYGLENNPIDRGLLNDIAFFNEFHLNLSELIAVYSKACKKAEDLYVFEEIVKDFYEATVLHNYAALPVLLGDADIQTDKKQIINQLKRFFEDQSNAVIF